MKIDFSRQHCPLHGWFDTGGAMWIVPCPTCESRKRKIAAMKKAARLGVG